MERWATFDCYGTLVDWNAGIGAALGDESLLARYHELEPRVQAEDPGMRYRDVLRETARRLGVPLSKVVVTVDEHANTSAASIPLALDVAVRDGRIRRGQNVLMEGVGGGFTWGATLVRF